MSNLKNRLFLKAMLTVMMVTALTVSFVFPGQVNAAAASTLPNIIGTTISNADPDNVPDLTGNALNNYGMPSQTPIVIAFDEDVTGMDFSDAIELYSYGESTTTPITIFDATSDPFGFLQNNEIAIILSGRVPGEPPYFVANNVYNLVLNGQTITFKTRQGDGSGGGDGGGGGQGANALYNIGGIVWEPAASIPADQRLLYAFSRNVPAVVDTNDNSDAIEIYKDGSLLPEADYDVSFVYAGYNTWIAIEPASGAWNYGSSYIVSIDRTLQANNGQNLQVVSEVNQSFTVVNAPPITPVVMSASPSASIEKLNGNTNNLTIIVAELYSDDTENYISKTFSIDNNSADVYHVNDNYKVYVDTKGNDQIRACYFVD